MRHLRATISFVFPAIACVIISAPVAFAYVASSTSYRIQADSVNVGGILSTSTSYRAEDTLGEEGVGTSSSSSYRIKAGYQQMQEVYIAVTAPGDVTLAPNIPSTGGGTANGIASWTVTTDNLTGYTMNIRASGTPALASGANNFPDYVPAGADPDFTFTTPGASSRFGFSPEGTDITQRYKDNGATCNVGALDTASSCWAPLSTTAITIASRATPNHPTGTVTSVRFRAQSGAGNTQPGGSYVATTTVTVLAL